MTTKTKVWLGAGIGGGVLALALIVGLVFAFGSPSGDAALMEGVWLDGKGGDVSFRSGKMYHSSSGQPSSYTVNQRDKMLFFKDGNGTAMIPYHFMDKDVLVLHLSSGSRALIRK